MPPIIVLKPENEEECANAVMQGMHRLYRDGDLCDVVLIAAKDGQRFPCHRLVLACTSPFFKALLTSEPRHAEIKLNEVSGKQLKPLLDFCYLDEMELQNEDEDHADFSTEVKDILCTASHLQWRQAVNTCDDFLQCHLTPANCLGICALAEQKKLDELKCLAEKCMLRDFVWVCQHEEFLQLSYERLALLIASDDLIVPTEETVFNNVMRWVQHDDLNRQKHIPQLLRLVRLRFLPAKFLQSNVESICKKHGCEQLFHDAMLWQTEPVNLLQSTMHLIKPRRKVNGELLVFFKDEDGETLIIDIYCPSEDGLFTFGEITPERGCFGTAVLNDSLFIVGGCSKEPNSSLDTVTSFNLKIKTFKELCPMQTQRVSLEVAVLDGMLYAVGGKSGEKYLKTVEQYDPVTNTWMFVASMKFARSLFGLAVLGGLLYAVGGDDDITNHCSTESYDPLTDKWTEQSEMNQARCEHGIAASSEFLYVVGGKVFGATLNSVERYDPRTNEWTRLCSLNVALGSAKCGLINNRLFALLGYGKVEEYDVKQNSWSRRNQRKSWVHGSSSLQKLVSIPKFENLNVGELNN